MALRNIAPRLSVLKPRLGFGDTNTKQFDKVRRTVEPWRNWYKTKRWLDLRWATFKRDHFTCQMCGKVEPDTSLLVCDHVKQHRGSALKFWDPDNLQTLCKSPCHDQHKQRLEAAERAAGGVV